MGSTGDVVFIGRHGFARVGFIVILQRSRVELVRLLQKKHAMYREKHGWFYFYRESFWSSHVHTDGWMFLSL